MGVCSVYGCNNNTEKKLTLDTSFHVFPKQKGICKKWISFCKRKDKINTKTAKICSLHFKKESFSNNVKYEMGFTSVRLLKSGSFPTIRVTEDEDQMGSKDYNSDRLKRIERKRNKEIVKELLEQSTPVEPAFENEFEFVSDQNSENNTFRENVEQQDESHRPIPTQLEILTKENDNLKEQIELLKKENNDLKTALTLSGKKIDYLKTQLVKSEYQKGNMESKLLDIFTGQLKNLKSDIFKNLCWSEEDTVKCLTLFSASPRAYRLLRQKKFPLPGLRTLQCWAQKLDISPGILGPVFNIMKAATELTEAQRVCVLSFDEMQIKEAYCYDSFSDTTFKPASFVQVVMLRGLVGKWKQPIFYDYDCKMTKQILMEILTKLKDCGFNVVAMTSDWIGSNRGLYNELDIDFNKPWFRFDENLVYVFADATQLLKLIRNNFTDHGFLMHGKIVRKEIILKLLSCTSEELGIAHKITVKHLDVDQAEREKVNLAAKLFSHTVSQALSEAVSLGLIEDESWEECYNLFKLTNDWFDIMNTRSLFIDSTEQNNILNRMSEMMMNMRVIGRNYMFPFQKGIIQSNTALQLLQKDLIERFDLKYVLTFRLNQDVLGNFFEVIRTRDGLPDLPDCQEFKHRLRSYILGFNEDALFENGMDNTPDFHSEERCLTGRIFNKIKVVDEQCSNDHESDLPLEYDRLENVASYICHRLKEENPEISEDDNGNSFFEVDPLSECDVSKPSERMMVNMVLLESVFNAVNGERLYIQQNYIGHMMTISEKAKIDCLVNVKEIFFRSRMYFRIKKLNREIIENRNSKKRKYKKK